MAPKLQIDTTDLTKTQDICPEFPPSTTPEELKAEYNSLNAQITTKLATLKSKTDEVEAAFEAMLPLYDQMQAMLSQCGPFRQMMDTAKMPSWTLWFSDHQKQCPIAPSYKKVQRAIRARRGTPRICSCRRTPCRSRWRKFGLGSKL